MAIRFPVLVTVATVAALVAPCDSARSKKMESNCHSRPNPNCLLKLAHLEAQELEQPAARVVTLTRIAVAESLAGYPEEAEASFAQALEIFDSPGLASEAESSDGQASVVSIIYRMPSSGMRILLDLPMPRSEQRLRSMLREFMVTAQVEAGRSVDGVELFIQRLNAPEFISDFYIAAAEAYAAAKRKDDARYFLLAAAEQAEIHTPQNIQRRTLDDVISLQIKMGDLEDAIATLSDSGVQLDTMTRIRNLTIVAHQQRSEGDQKSALETLAIVDEFIDGIEEDDLRVLMRENYALQEPYFTAEVENYGGGNADSVGGRWTGSSAMRLAISDAESGNFEAAVKRALELEFEPARLTTLGKIAGIRAERGDPEGAHKTANLIADGNFRSLAVRRIAEAQVKEGNFEGFRDTVEMIPSESIRYETLTESIWPLVEAGATVHAASIARDLLLPEERAKAYVTMVLAMARKAAAGEKH